MKELLRAAFSQFEKNQIANVDAELLLAHLLGVSRKQIHSQLIELNDADREKISFYGVCRMDKKTGPHRFVCCKAQERKLRF